MWFDPSHALTNEIGICWTNSGRICLGELRKGSGYWMPQTLFPIKFALLEES